MSSRSLYGLPLAFAVMVAVSGCEQSDGQDWRSRAVVDVIAVGMQVDDLDLSDEPTVIIDEDTKKETKPEPKTVAAKQPAKVVTHPACERVVVRDRFGRVVRTYYRCPRQ